MEEWETLIALKLERNQYENLELNKWNLKFAYTIPREKFLNFLKF